MICEIINPSDMYTLETEDFDLAGVTIAMLGGGKLGLVDVDDESGLRTPVLFGWDEWFKERGLDEDGAVDKLLEDRLGEMIAILDSVLIGGPGARRFVRETLKRIPKEQHAEWLLEYHDSKRSSLNDIGRAAWEWADKLRKIQSQNRAAS